MKTQIIKIPLPGKGFKRFYLSDLIIVGLSAAAILNSALLVLPSNTTRTVYSTADSGAGSLREVLGNASSGDSILFDQSIFPPDNPATISLNSVLPRLNQGNLIIDASNAGVILNGRKISTSETVGIYVFSDNNIIRGLQIEDFSKAGIVLEGEVKNNTIGGDRNIGTGPSGQGNMITGDGTFAIALWNDGTSNNTIIGNIIGTDPGGTTMLGSFSGGIFLDGANYNVIEDNLIGGYLDGGIGLGGVSGGYNIVRGNYIGTNPSGETDIANSQANGITIRSGFNTIGPDNIIANNNGTGIVVDGSLSVSNRITQNSIFNNGGSGDAFLALGIDLDNGGNLELAAPVLLDFDMQAGTVTGFTCANCMVEVFSDLGEEGEVYEGQTTADENGIFTFNKETSFTLPHLTATATDADGNTSQFSSPTPDVPNRTTVLQNGNTSSLYRIIPKPSGELVDNRIGGGWHLPWILELGAKRTSFSISTIEGPSDNIDWSLSEFSVSPQDDEFVNTLIANGVKLTLVMNFWDKANHPNGWEEPAGFSRFQTEEDIQRYLDFVRFHARHFKDRVEYFNLWNEPDNGGIPIQYIRVPDYINLVKRVVPIIRQESPEAKIVVGYTSNLMYSEEYLFGLLRSDEIMPLVDVINWQPFFSQSPEFGYDPDVGNPSEYYYNYPSLAQSIKDTAEAHGFSGEYYAPMGWDTHSIYGPGTGSCCSYTPTVAAKYYARVLMMHLGMDITVEAGSMNPANVLPFNTVRNLATIMAGAEPDTVPVVIQSEAVEIKSAGFSLPGGDKMVALWTDGIAEDYDPGVTATVTLPGLSNPGVTAIDVLNGFKQELTTAVNDGDLVISNLVVKDYPIILSMAGEQNMVTVKSSFKEALFQNYPNPFNKKTTFSYQLTIRSNVKLEIFTLTGQKLTTLVSSQQPAGIYNVEWDASDYESGVYIYRLSASDYVQMKKMILLR